ncbi:uncharacterized protein PHACADRAFT_203658 [Phanerochaete carnosa HHB-10118-sp]|uniref:Uncharacterized protein n=1 Tax=Phanerochaete carnosa (strain HHB-10118-sp) TaxID=650164 RepID=K5VC15_PHACS|nr:uncharacterized protein PHACADRAFT_203658 [Phanerochaete carnosa HHB-10118-sp]EKM60461.1 hypothetical protein PHACADRAFT_203658 [Phanerochaete carnosa HHB-10118-sp]
MPSATLTLACREVAQIIASAAVSQGFLTAVGWPCNNSAHFLERLANPKGKQLSEAFYTVFCCGGRDWILKYQRILTLCDDILAERGGHTGSSYLEAFEK